MNAAATQEQQATLLMPLDATDAGALTTVPQAPAAQTGALVVTPSDLLRIAMESGDKDLDRLERLMAMEERYRAKQAELAFREAFAAFKGESIVVHKTKTVEQRAKGGGAGPKYDQSELHVVAGLLQPALSRHGFGFRFDVKFIRPTTEGDVPWCEVTCKLEHSAGHVETLTLGGPPDDSGAKNPLQEMQSSATFLQRHALLAITGTAQAGKDNDGRGARGYEADQAAGADDPQRDALIQAGQAASISGMAALNKWWQGLTDQQRKALTAEFGAMRTAAREFDKDARK